MEPLGKPTQHALVGRHSDSSLAAARGLVLSSVDISGAFLQERLAEVVYVKFATRLWQGAPTDTIVRLCRSLYGLRQAPRCFQLGLFKFLEESGYAATVSDPCVFTKRLDDGSDQTVLAHVDDHLIMGTSSEAIIVRK